jgi:hypothetical protein
VRKARACPLRIEVNLEELFRIIDGGMQAPLSEAEGEKLKTVLRALAQRVAPRSRTTEKTRAVLDNNNDATPAAKESKLEAIGRRRGTGATAPLRSPAQPVSWSRMRRSSPATFVRSAV